MKRVIGTVLVIVGIVFGGLTFPILSPMAIVGGLFLGFGSAMLWASFTKSKN